MRGWSKVRIGDVCRVIPGYAFKSRDWSESGLPVVKIKNIKADCTVDLSEVDFVPESVITSRLEKFKLQDGDILLAMTGATAGKVGKLKTRKPVYLNQRVAKISPFAVHAGFIWAVVSSKRYQELFFKLADGAAQPNMSGGQIEGVEFLLPPTDEQRRIASILSAYDDLIENNTRRIAILEEMARRIYEEWFIHFRFPGHEQVKMVESELGLIPEGWRSSRIGNEFKTVLGGTPSRSKPEYWEGGTIPWINSGKVNELRILEPSEFITPLGLTKSSTKLMPAGTTLLAITGATLGQVSFLEAEMCANQSVVGIIDTTKKHSEFIYRTIQHKIPEIIQRASGGAQQHINKDIVNEIDILLPTDANLESFNNTATPLGRLIANLLKQNHVLRSTRDLLLPKLISGELDVSTLPEPEEAIAA